MAARMESLTEPIIAMIAILDKKVSSLVLVAIYRTNLSSCEITSQNLKLVVKNNFFQLR